MRRITTSEPDVMSQLRHPLPLLLGIIFHSAVALADPVRVAITPFHAESNSPLVAEMGEGYAMMFFTGALGVDGVEMVERDPGSPLWNELPLGEAGLTTEWEGVDIVVRGRLESKASNFNPLFPYTLKLEFIDVTNAAILETIKFEKKDRRDEKRIGESLVGQASNLLQAAIDRHRLLQQSTRIVPLFFFNNSPNERLENFELDFGSIVEETLRHEQSPLVPLFFGGGEEAIEEQSLNWLGFTKEDRTDSWKNVADYFIWGEFAEVDSEEFQNTEQVRVEATIFWLGRDETNGEVSDTFRVADFKEGVSKMVAKLPDTPIPPGISSGNGTAKRIADLLLERAMPLLNDDLREILTHNPETEELLTSRISEIENSYAKNLIFASCLFDPADPGKQYAMLHFGEGSKNPALNARRIDRVESWLANSENIPPEKHLPRAASANLLEERIRLSRHSWWKPAGHPTAPVASYQTEDSIERFVRLMDRVTVMLGQENVQKVRNTTLTIGANSASKMNGYADRFLSGILFDLIWADWMKTEHKARLFALAWRLIPQGERRDFLAWKKKEIDKLTEQIGEGEWQRILQTPSLVETRDPSNPTQPASPAHSNPSKTKPQTFVFPGKPRPTRQALRDRLRLSKGIEKDFESQGFVAQEVRMIRPGQLIVRGKYAGEIEGVTPWRPYYMVSDGSAKVPPPFLEPGLPGFPGEFRWATFGRRFEHPFHQLESSPDRRSLVLLPGIFEAQRKQQWSSDGRWAVRLDYQVDDEQSVDTSGLDLFRLIQVDPEGEEIADLSPPDLNLIKNTSDRIVIVEDRWIVLIGYATDRFEINRLDLSDKSWQTRNITIPDLENQAHLDEDLPPGRSIVACGKWVFIGRGNSGVIFNIKSGTTLTLDKLYSSIIDRELARMRKVIESKGLNDRDLNRAIDAWKFAVDTISVYGEEIFLLHTGGLASFKPADLETGELNLRHLDFRDQSLRFNSEGGPSWRIYPRHRCETEVGKHWIWLARDSRGERFYLFDRENLTLDGTVDLVDRLPYGRSEMHALGDSIYLTYEGKRKELKFETHPVPSIVISRLSTEELMKAAKPPIPAK